MLKIILITKLYFENILRFVSFMKKKAYRCIHQNLHVQLLNRNKNQAVEEEEGKTLCFAPSQKSNVIPLSVTKFPWRCDLLVFCFSNVCRLSRPSNKAFRWVWHARTVLKLPQCRTSKMWKMTQTKNHSAVRSSPFQLFPLYAPDHHLLGMNKPSNIMCKMLENCAWVCRRSWIKMCRIVDASHKVIIFGLNIFSTPIYYGGIGLWVFFLVLISVPSSVAITQYNVAYKSYRAASPFDVYPCVLILTSILLRCNDPNWNFYYTDVVAKRANICFMFGVWIC